MSEIQPPDRPESDVTPPPISQSNPVDPAPEPSARPGRRTIDLPPNFVDETLPETAVRLTRNFFQQRAQPALKQALIKTLRSTVTTLEGTIGRLEATPESIVVPPVATQAELTESPVAATAPVTLDRTTSRWQQIQTVWGALLGRVRSWLPASLRPKLDDRALTGAIVGVAIGLLLIPSFSSNQSFSNQSRPPEAVSPAPGVPPAPVVTPAPQPIPPEVKAPEPSQPIAISPTPSPSPTPAPTLKRTPEQPLIASIQDQVAGVSDRYASGLIQSVRANFRSSRLVVTVGDAWYGLSESQQTKLSNDLLKRAQELDFVKLELIDPAAALLARSPVVGSEMIILKRVQDATTA